MADHSRVGRLAAGAADVNEKEVLERLDAACVHLSLDATLAGAWLTLKVMVTTLRRMPGRVHLDPTGLGPDQVDRLRLAASELDPERPLEVGTNVPAGSVHLHVGTAAPASGVVRVIPDGYGLQLARDAEVHLHQHRPAHPLGSITAAAFGVAEAFKDLAPVVEARRQDHGYFAWCPVALSADLMAAPMLDRQLTVDLGLAGCGAIGTANALILSELDAGGDILVMDRQAFGTENIPTYSVGGEEDAKLGRRKVDIVGDLLSSKYSVRRRQGDVEGLVDDVDSGKIPWPRTVLAGLDSVPARHGVQLLWPDRLIDGATGDTAVGLHDVKAGEGPCLFCFFPPGGRLSSQVIVAQKTGLGLDVIGRGDDPLREEDIAHLEPEKREQLRPFLGNKICNVASAFGLVEGAGEFGAAVTFVALQAACHSIGRLLAVELGIDGLNFGQYDALLGPRSEDFERRRARGGCYCQDKAARITKIRALRREGGT